MRPNGPVSSKRVEDQTSESANKLKFGGSEDAGNITEQIEACRGGFE